MNLKHKAILDVFICITCISVLLGSAIAQKVDNFSTGLPEEKDLEIIKANIQVPMTSKIYQFSNSAASIKQYSPVPKDQGPYGTCAAWATGYCARTIIEAYRQGITDKNIINKMAFSPAFIFRMTKGNVNDNCRSSNVGALSRKMMEVGIPLLSDYPELCAPTLEDLSSKVRQKATNNKIQGFVQLWNEENYKKLSQSTKVDAVKLSINNGKPVIVSMFTTPTFHEVRTRPGIWKPLASETPGSYKGKHGRHAVVIVGYDDNFNGGSFEVQNSWGESWGDGGYFWVNYKDFHNYIYAGVELQHLPDLSISKNVKLEGALSLNLADNALMRATVNGEQFKLVSPYASGTRFRFYLDNNEPAYVYAFGTDGTHKTYQIFPHLPNVSPLLDYKLSQVAIPSEQHTIRMDGTVGTDYFCVLYSKLPLNLEDIRRKLEQQDKKLPFKQKLQLVLGNKMISNPVLSIDKRGAMRFKASSTTGAYVVPLITEMKHI